MRLEVLPAAHVGSRLNDDARCIQYYVFQQKLLHQLTFTSPADLIYLVYYLTSFQSVTQQETDARRILPKWCSPLPQRAHYIIPGLNR